MTRDPFDDYERESRVERDFSREPTLHRPRPRPTVEEFRLRALLVGFRADDEADPTEAPDPSAPAAAEPK